METGLLAGTHTPTKPLSAAPRFASHPSLPATTTARSTSHSNHLRFPDHLASLIDRCKSLAHLLQIHAAVLRHGHENHPILNFKLQKSYSSLGCLNYSSTLFAQTTNPNVFFYTDIIRGHIIRGLHDQALCFYVQMLVDGVEPNPFTFSAILKSCPIEPGIVLHSHAIKLGFDGDSYVRTGLLHVYARWGDLVSAKKLFDTMPERSVVSVTAMLASYAKHGYLDFARNLFDEIPERDLVCWNVMIDGYAQHGEPNESLLLFRQMLKANLTPDEVTLLPVLSACAQLGALGLGRWIHSYVVNNSIPISVHLGTALIDMYSKCGSLEDAKVVFDGINCKDVIAWNSMIVGYAMHGSSQEALSLFNEMCERGFCPTDITFIGILNACAHSGLVTQGRGFFNSMKNDYGFEPKIEHYGCMVNLLGRAGHVQEAYDLVKNAEIEPDPVLWGTLLGACRLHGNVSLGEEIADFLFSKNLANSGTFILLSNIYASTGNWHSVAQVRTMMKASGVDKEPGCSSIEVRSKVHEFLAGDLRHPKSKEIYAMLRKIEGWLKDHGYTPQTGVVLQDIGEREKELSLAVHSEKLAIAFGLISTEPGSTIRIVKNLRVCSDCHEVSKLLSKITGRKIVVRDRNRFHHFVDGSCSCGDYW